MTKIINESDAIVLRLEEISRLEVCAKNFLGSKGKVSFVRSPELGFVNSHLFLNNKGTHISIRSSHEITVREGYGNIDLAVALARHYEQSGFGDYLVLVAENIR